MTATKRNGGVYVLQEAEVARYLADAREAIALAIRDWRQARRFWRSPPHYSYGPRYPAPSVALALEAQEAAAGAETLCRACGRVPEAYRWSARRAEWARRVLVLTAYFAFPVLPADAPPAWYRFNAGRAAFRSA